MIAVGYVHTWQKSWHINKSNNGNVEGIQESNKSSCFYRSIDIKTTWTENRKIRIDIKLKIKRKMQNYTIVLLGLYSYPFFRCYLPFDVKFLPRNMFEFLNRPPMKPWESQFSAATSKKPVDPHTYYIQIFVDLKWARNIHQYNAYL